MEFEGHHFTDRVSLLDAIRSTWTGVWLQPWGDEGDQTPLAWLVRLGGSHPEWQPVVSAVLAELLLDDSGLEYGALFELLDLPWDPLPEIAGWIANQVPRLIARPSPADSSRSVMGDLVVLMGRRPLATGLPTTLADALMTIDQPRDGYPEAALRAMAIAPDRYLDRLVLLLESMSEESLTGVIERLLGSEPTFSDAAFAVIGGSQPALRRKVFAVVKSTLERAAVRVEEQLANPALPDHVKAMLKKAQGTHARREKQLAEVLGVETG